MNKKTSADKRGEQTVASNQWLVIGASSLGTIFEWYDFYLYGLLATVISAQFFSGVNEVTGFIFALAAFAAGFAVRPFGALVFGRLGDLVGRKHTFLITMSHHGCRDLCGRPAAELRDGRGRRAHHAGAAAPAAGAGARRRIRRRRNLRRRACAAGQARIVHELDSDHGDSRLVRRVAGGHRHSHAMGEDAFKPWGWRIPVPAVHRAAGRLAVDPHAARREPGIRQNENRRARPRKPRSPRRSGVGAI